MVRSHMDKSRQSYRNRLLNLLDPAAFERLRSHLKPVTFEYRKPLFVYFPVTGVASLVNTMANGSATEVGTIGNEGIVGLPVLFSDDRAPTTAYVQVPGSGLRLSANVLRDELDN